MGFKGGGGALFREAESSRLVVRPMVSIGHVIPTQTNHRFLPDLTENDKKKSLLFLEPIELLVGSKIKRKMLVNEHI